MIKRSRRRSRVQRILEPALCLRCSHAWLIEAEDNDGNPRPMFYCSRGDCDNWVTRSEEEHPGCKAGPDDLAS